MATQLTKEKARLIAEIVNRHYEPHRQDRCLMWVFRNHVSKVYPMSERTFRRYIKLAKTLENGKILDKRKDSLSS
jgi:hypothetical protein